MKVLKSSKKRNAQNEHRAQQIIDTASANSISSDLVQPNKANTHLGLDDFGANFETELTGAKPSTNRRTNRGRRASQADKTKATLTSGSDENESGDSAGAANKDEAASEFKTLMHKAVHLLSMREHSIQELSVKLQSRSEDQDTVFAVMDFLKENDYVSDDRFTEAFVRARANKGHGPTKIKADLKGKGVHTVIIEEHLDASAAKWFDIALSLYAKKYGDDPVSDYNTWSKRARFLQSRGFTMDQIQATVPQVNYD